MCCLITWDKDKKHREDQEPATWDLAWYRDTEDFSLHAHARWGGQFEPVPWRSLKLTFHSSYIPLERSARKAGLMHGGQNFLSNWLMNTELAARRNQIPQSNGGEGFTEGSFSKWGWRTYLLFTEGFLATSSEAADTDHCGREDTGLDGLIRSSLALPVFLGWAWTSAPAEQNANPLSWLALSTIMTTKIPVPGE